MLKYNNFYYKIFSDIYIYICRFFFFLSYSFLSIKSINRLRSRVILTCKMTNPSIESFSFDENYENPRAIPRVHFVEDIAKWVKSSGDTAENLLKRLSEQYSKYKLAEHKLIKSTANLESKIPDIKKTLQTLHFLKKQLAESEKGFTTNYGLTESVFCEAEVPPQKTVHLWLGANVMVEYSFDEAIALLERNLKSATENLLNTQEDLAWLQEQQTVLEVNNSRVYNYDVIQHRQAEK